MLFLRAQLCVHLFEQVNHPELIEKWKATKIIKLFSNHKVKQTLILAFARFAGVALGFAVSIINTRFLDTEDYGKLKFIQQIIVILPTLLGLGFSFSVGRLVACKEHAGRSTELVRASNLISGVLSLCATALLLIFSIFVDRLFDTNIKRLLICLSPFAFIYFFRISVTNLLQGQNHIYLFSGWQIFPQLLYVLVASVVIWKFKFSLSISLAILVVTGALITIVGLLKISQRGYSFSRNDLRLVFRENRSNGFQVYLGSLASVLVAQLIPVFVGYYADMKSVGYYGLAFTMSSPLLFIPSTIATVMFKSFANHLKINTKVLLVALSSSFIVYVVFFFAIKYVVQVVYPHDYLKTVPMARILGFGMICHGLGEIFNRFLGAHGQGKLLRNGAFALGITIIIMSTMLMPIYGIWGGIIAKTISSLVFLLCMAYYYQSYTKSMNCRRMQQSQKIKFQIECRNENEKNGNCI